MLAILTTHPIQYQVPIWQALARNGRVPFEVWYLTRHGIRASHDQEFGKKFSWDIETLSGYPYQFLDVATGATPTSFWNCRLRERLAGRIRSSGVRALWLQGWQVAAYWQAVWEARRVGVEVWLRGESNDLAPTPLWKRGVKRLLLGQFFRHVDRFLYVGSANRRLYQKYGVSEDHLYPAPYAVDNNRFAQQASAIRSQRMEIRRHWNIPDDAFCVLFCGKFIPKKRPMDLVAAAGILLRERRGPKIHLLFVGSGQLGPKLRSSCHVVFDAENPSAQTALPSDSQRSGLGPSHLAPSSSPRPPASFAGFLNQTEISKAYVAADCLVLPSDYGETWGLVVNEAAASGLPGIISDRCGCVEDVVTCSGNIKFACGSPPDLTRALSQALMSDHNISPSSPLSSFDETVESVVSLFGQLDNVAAEARELRTN